MSNTEGLEVGILGESIRRFWTIANANCTRILLLNM